MRCCEVALAQSLVSEGDRGTHRVSESKQLLRDQTESDLDNIPEHDSTPGEGFFCCRGVSGLLV